MYLVSASLRLVSDTVTFGMIWPGSASSAFSNPARPRYGRVACVCVLMVVASAAALATVTGHGVTESMLCVTAVTVKSVSGCDVAMMVTRSPAVNVPSPNSGNSS